MEVSPQPSKIMAVDGPHLHGIFKNEYMNIWNCLISSPNIGTSRLVRCTLAAALQGLQLFSTKWESISLPWQTILHHYQNFVPGWVVEKHYFT